MNYLTDEEKTLLQNTPEWKKEITLRYILKFRKCSLSEIGNLVWNTRLEIAEELRKRGGDPDNDDYVAYMKVWTPDLLDLSIDKRREEIFKRLDALKLKSEF